MDSQIATLNYNRAARKLGAPDKEPGTLLALSQQKLLENNMAKVKALSKKKPMVKAKVVVKTKVKGTVPKTTKGKAMVAKLGRTKKTGGFAKIASKAGVKYGSKTAGKKVAGAIFNKMVKARKK